MNRRYYKDIGYGNLVAIILLNGIRNLGTVAESFLTKYLLDTLTKKEWNYAVLVMLVKVMLWVLVIGINNYYQNFKQYLQKKADVVGKTIIAKNYADFNQASVNYEIEEKIQYAQENAKAPFSLLFNAVSLLITVAAFFIIILKLIRYSYVYLFFSLGLAVINLVFAYKLNDIEFISKTRTFDSEKNRRNIRALFYDLKSLKEVRVWSCQDYLLDRYGAASAQTFLHVHKANRSSLVYTIVNELVWAILTVFVFWYSTNLYQKSIFLIGDCAFIIEIWCTMNSQIDDLKLYVLSVLRDKRSINIYNSVFKDKRSVREHKSEGSEETHINKIECHNVSFSYAGGGNILNNITCTLERGKCYILLGRNGAGKSTFSRLLQGELVPDFGEIVLNGSIDSRQEEYYKVISENHSFLGQESTHFSISVKDNVCMGKEYDEAKVENALKTVGLYDKVHHFESKEDEILGKDYLSGAELSGGQWQKLALARMIYAGSDFIILDEPTAEVDALTEREFYREVKNIFSDKIVFLITHKSETISIADSIFFISNGVLYFDDNIESLRRKCRDFDEMCIISEQRK